MNTRPSIETIAGLYRAAFQQDIAAHVAIDRIIESAKRHGYTEAEVIAAAGIRECAPAASK